MMLTRLPSSCENLLPMLPLIVCWPQAGQGLLGAMSPRKRFVGSLKEIEGFGEMFRFLSFKKIGTSTLAEPGCRRGWAGGTYLFALPGSPSACRDAWDDLLVHQLDYRHRPCNFASEIMPRLQETGLTGRASGK